MATVTPRNVNQSPVERQHHHWIYYSTSKCLSCRTMAALPNKETCGHPACVQHVKEAELWAKKVCDRVLSHWKRP